MRKIWRKRLPSLLCTCKILPCRVFHPCSFFEPPGSCCCPFTSISVVLYAYVQDCFFSEHVFVVGGHGIRLLLLDGTSLVINIVAFEDRIIFGVWIEYHVLGVIIAVAVGFALRPVEQYFLNCEPSESVFIR